MAADATPDVRPDVRPDRGLRRALREPVNSLTHLLGAVLAAVATVVLVAASRGEPWRAWSFAVFGLSSVALFTSSTLLHALWVGETGRGRLRRLDHGAIFLLIAGSYTPVTLVTLRAVAPAWGWALFAAVWTLALAGLVGKIGWPFAPRWVSTALYLLVGWLAVVAIVPITRALPPGGLAWLVAGGACYSVGAVIYALKRPRLWPGVFGFHELWHVLVLGGWGSHVALMGLYVLPS